MIPPVFTQLEEQRGLPRGILDALWAIESSRGRNMLNRQSGAAGHFQMMPANVRAAGIDPYNLAQSARWTADNAAAGLRHFPNLSPIAAVAGHHFAGPNRRLWGPKTQAYIQRANSLMNAGIGGRPVGSGIGGAPVGAGVGGGAVGAGIYPRPASAPPSRPGPVALPAPAGATLPPPVQMPAPISAPTRTRPDVRSGRFWLDVAAAMDPQVAPMAALATGVSSAMNAADTRRMALEDKLYRKQIADITRAELQAKLRAQEVDIQAQRRKDLAMAEAMQYMSPRERAILAATGRVPQAPTMDPRESRMLDLELAEQQAKMDERIARQAAINDLMNSDFLTAEQKAHLSVMGRFPEVPVHLRDPDEALYLENLTNTNKAIRERGAKARSEMATASIMQGQLEQGVETGFWEPMRMLMRRYGGFSQEQLANQEFFEAQAGQFVLAGLEGLSGAISDSEREYLARLSPDIGKTEDANYLLLELYRRSAARHQDMEQKLPQYLREKNAQGKRDEISEADFNRWYFDSYDIFPEFKPTDVREQFRQRRQNRQYPGLGRIPETEIPGGPPPGFRESQ